jgi:uncharacterized protein YbjT (DUF2867 family)
MIVVTTPTGNIGSQVVKNLLAVGEAVRVIARDPAKLAPEVRGKVEVVQGSHGDIDVVSKAFEGADSVFWLVPPAIHAESAEAAYVDFTRPACEAFRSAGVTHVVGVSSLGRGTALAEHAGLITASLAMDDLIAASGVSYRALAMPAFMENLLGQAEPIKSQGMFFAPNPGDLKAATCATRDIAAVAATLLRDRSWSGRGEVAVLGPEDLSFNDMARIMSEVLGKPVQFQEISPEAMKSGLVGRGWSEPMAQSFMEMMTAINAGIYSSHSRTPESSTSTSFRQWCEDVLKSAVLG